MDHNVRQWNKVSSSIYWVLLNYALFFFFFSSVSASLSCFFLSFISFVHCLLCVVAFARALVRSSSSSSSFSSPLSFFVCMTRSLSCSMDLFSANCQHQFVFMLQFKRTKRSARCFLFKMLDNVSLFMHIISFLVSSICLSLGQP